MQNLPTYWNLMGDPDNSKYGFTPERLNYWKIDIKTENIKLIDKTSYENKWSEIKEYGEFKNFITYTDESIPEGSNKNLISNSGNKFKDLLRLMQKSVTTPNQTIESKEVQLQFGKFYMGGKMSFEDLSVTFREIQGFPISTMMKIWIFGQIFNPKTLKYGQVQDYKTEQVISLYKHGDNDLSELKHQWKVYGIFPTGVDIGEFSIESDDPKELSVTFQTDFVEQIN